MGSAALRLKHGDSLQTETFMLEEHKQREVERREDDKNNPTLTLSDRQEKCMK